MPPVKPSRPGNKRRPAPPEFKEFRSLADIPGYREAVEAESQNWDLAFFGITENIFGVHLRPMTLEDFMVLEKAHSPFLFRRNPNLRELITFLWVLSPEYPTWRRFYLSTTIPTFSRWAGGIRQFIFGLQVRRIPVRESVERIFDYIKTTFQDCPGGAGDGHKKYASFVAFWIDLLASEYGWSREYILKLPMREIFQYFKRIQMRLNPKSAMFNQSDQIIQKWMNERNQKKSEN